MDAFNEKTITDKSKAKVAAQTLEMRRGNTTFLVSLCFAEEGKKTLEGIVKELFIKEVEAGTF